MMPSNDGKSCVDVNECKLDKNLCKGGVCINTEGSFICRCPPGLSLDASGTFCSDERREPCYQDSRQGVCSRAIEGLYKRDQCYCALGEAWGNGCDRCPRPGTRAFDELCPL